MELICIFSSSLRWGLLSCFLSKGSRRKQSKIQEKKISKVVGFLESLNGGQGPPGLSRRGGRRDSVPQEINGNSPVKKTRTTAGQHLNRSRKQPLLLLLAFPHFQVTVLKEKKNVCVAVYSLMWQKHDHLGGEGLTVQPAEAETQLQLKCSFCSAGAAFPPSPSAAHPVTAALKGRGQGAHELLPPAKGKGRPWTEGAVSASGHEPEATTSKSSPRTPGELGSQPPPPLQQNQNGERKCRKPNGGTQQFGGTSNF